MEGVGAVDTRSAVRGPRSFDRSRLLTVIRTTGLGSQYFSNKDWHNAFREPSRISGKSVEGSKVGNAFINIATMSKTTSSIIFLAGQQVFT